MTTIAISLFALSAVVACCGIWSAARARSLIAARRHQGEFFRLACELARDPDCPVSRLDDLNQWALLLGNRKSVWLLSKALAEMAKDTARPIRFDVDLDERLRVTDARMFASWCLAVTYQAPVLGFFVRAQLAAMLDPNVRLRAERKVLESTRWAHG